MAIIKNALNLIKRPFKKWLIAIILCCSVCHPCFSATAKKNIHLPKKIQRITHVKPKLKSTPKSHPIHHAKKILTRNNKSMVNKKNHAVHTHATTPSHLPSYLLNTTEKRLVGFVQQTVSTLNYSFYKLGGTQIDAKRGIYIVDCSTYVDHIMKSVYPNSYSHLVSWSGSQKPTTNDYYQYFTNLSERNKLLFWDNINNVNELRPGDILVFRYKNVEKRQAGGHVMIVMDKPIHNGDSFLVRVADSAAVGHSKDTRLPNRSGIGIGTLLLRTNSTTFKPTAYAWRVGSRWEYNVKIAMARPKNIG